MITKQQVTKAKNKSNDKSA